MQIKKAVVGVVSAFVMVGSFGNTSLAASAFQAGVQGNSSVQAGQANSYSVWATDSGAAVANAVVDFEVYNSSGAKVYQQFFTNQNFGTGQTQSYNVSWTPAAAGSYVIDAGVFSSGWSATLGWAEDAISVQATAGSAAPRFSSAVNPPQGAATGQSAQIESTVTDSGGGASNALVDFEVYNSSGAKVYQQFFTNQNFGTGQTQSYNVSWTPAAAGSYSVDVGVFSTDWTSEYYWGNDVATLTVAGGAPSFAVQGSVSPSTVSAGQVVSADENITNTGGPVSNAITDIEIENSSGAKVYQQFFTNQNFGTGQTQSYNVSWTPSATSTPGTYSVNVGIFSANWASQLLWDDTTQVNVAASPAMAITEAPLAQSSPSEFSASEFYVEPSSSALSQAVQWQSSDPTDAERMTLIGDQPQAVWFGGWNSDVTTDVNTLVSAAQTAGKIPLLVAYNIPDRDCGGFSAGGAETPAAYEAWIQGFAAGIGSRPAWVILEPDALASMDCLSAADQSTRLSLLTYAVKTLESLGNTRVYIDAGNSDWISAPEMATRLQEADIADANGFSLNVSNFQTTAASTQYGTTLSSLVGGKHFVIDTSRNGAGSDGQWCNPPGMALGQLPTTDTGNSSIDAYLWIKVPGESDGTCNGGPSAGTWWPQYAVSLAANAGY